MRSNRSCDEYNSGVPRVGFGMKLVQRSMGVDTTQGLVEPLAEAVELEAPLSYVDPGDEDCGQCERAAKK